MAAIGQLSQRLAKQREEIDQLRVDQHIQFQTLTEKLDGLADALIGAQRSNLAEHAKEQRILILAIYIKTDYVIDILCSRKLSREKTFTDQFFLLVACISWRNLTRNTETKSIAGQIFYFLGQNFHRVTLQLRNL